MIYFDTSALIKRFVIEKGSRAVQQLFTDGGPPASATVAYVEVYSGLARKYRQGHLTKKNYALACRQFETDWPAYIRVELAEDLLLLSRDLIHRHPLRAFDAIHLASVLSLQDALGVAIPFVAADERLLQAAAVEHLQTFNVESDEPSQRG